jgi:hypothetical protein
MLVVFEALVLQIADQRGMDRERMLWRHANLE